MIRPLARPFLLCAAAVALGAPLGACVPITQFQGFQAVDAKPTDIKAGVDTRATVSAKLGSPSQVSTFDKDVWFYMSAKSEKYAFYRPRTTQREITAIRFDKEQKVAEVKTLNLKDGFQIAYDKRETPTRGRELTVLEQLLGNVGRGGLLPQDNDPGNPRGAGGR